MSKQLAHNWEDKERTKDVEIDDNISFSQMFLSDNVLKGLTKNGFKIPSPIQLRAIPLGKSGLDLIVQAKSGTGKTLVFSVIILEAYNSEISAPQSLILVPTREIAVQITNVLSSISSTISSFKVSTFIGGLDIIDDRKRMQNCKCIVGTPGRVLQLIKNKILNVDYVKILVFDEADKLMETSFLADINKINRALKSRKQLIASSATVDNKLRSIISSYMKNPLDVTPKKEIPVLLGVKQFAVQLADESNNLKEMMSKIEEMKHIFKTISFKQCLVFSNSQSRAESYSNLLNREEWPSEVMIGSHDQVKRLSILNKLKEFKCRILITTDLMSRGIDIENVNLVINLDVPDSGPSYLHRIGRAGRYGSYGIAITLVKTGNDMKKFQKLLGAIGGDKMSVMKFPAHVVDLWNFDNCADEKIKFGEIFGTDKENIKVKNFEETEESDINVVKEEEGSKSADILSENLKLLEISSLLVDRNKKTISYHDDDDGLDIFNTYQPMNEVNDEMIEQTIDEIENDKKDPESNSTITNIGTDVITNEPDDSDSDISQYGSSSEEEVDSSDTSCDDREVEDEKQEECQIFYRNLSNNEIKSINNSNEILWQKIYMQQIRAIQNYISFCRRTRMK